MALKVPSPAPRTLRQMADDEAKAPDPLTPEQKAAFEQKWLPSHLALLKEELAKHRADLQDLDKKAPGDGMTLDDVVDFLRTPQGTAIARKLEKQLAPDETSLGEDPKWKNAPRDHFEETVRKELAAADPMGFGLDPNVIVRALAKGFAEVTGRDGRIDEKALHAEAPGTGGKIYDYVTDVTHRAPLPNNAPGTKLLGLDDATVARVGRGIDLQPILDRMPGFDAVAAKLLDGKQPFKDVKVVCVQHLLPTFAGVLNELEKGGAKKEDVHLIGKSYSTVDDMYAWTVGQGYDVDPQSIGGNADSVEEHLVEAARQKLTELFDGVDPKTSTQRFVLADDGGNLLYTLNKFFPQYAHLCVGFEQTARGIQVLQQMQKDGTPVLCPIINMAKSDLKAATEIPLIGENVVFDALQDLDEMKLPQPKTATVLGFGAVGQQTVKALQRRGIDVVVYDPSPEAQAAARAAGLKVASQQDALGAGDIVFGVTGHGAMTLDDYKYLKDGAVLVNGASGNHELGTEAFGTKGRWFREMAYEPDKLMVSDTGVSAMFQGRRVELGQGDLGSPSQHRIVKDHETGKEALVLRSGHVVNLGSDLPPEWIQVTRSLVFGSMVQALNTKDPGIVDVDPKIQQLIRDTVESDLKSKGLSLEHPDFRKVASWDV
jgi:S-adenosylhomocysteine hydrolase